MPDTLTARAAELVRNGRELVDELTAQADEDWIDYGEVAIHESWLGKVGQMLLDAQGPESSHFRKFREIVTSQRNPVGVQTYVVRHVFDLVLSVLESWSTGSLRRYEDMVAAPILDDLLDQAADLRAEERNVEAAAVARAVFEQALRRIAANCNLQVTGRSLEQVAGELIAIDRADDTLGTRLREALATRDRIATADWSEVGADRLDDLIVDTRDLVSQFI